MAGVAVSIWWVICLDQVLIKGGLLYSSLISVGQHNYYYVKFRPFDNSVSGASMM